MTSGRDVVSELASEVGLSTDEVRAMLGALTKVLVSAGPALTARAVLADGSSDVGAVSMLAFAAGFKAVHASEWLSGPALGQLPEDERAHWQAAGADFDATGDPVGRSKERTAIALGELVGSCLLGDAAVAARLHISRSRVSQRISQRSIYMFGIEDERCFPSWQFTDGNTLPGLGTVLRELRPAVHPLTVHHWFTTPHVDLQVLDRAVSPVEWLRTGGDAGHLAALVTEL